MRFRVPHLLALHFLLVLGLFTCSLTSVFAQQRELKSDAAESMDAVLILDSSGSMLLNDPARLRDEGARLFVQFLKAGDRLSIIQFAEEAKVVRPLSPFDPTQNEEVAREITQIASTGQYTDLLSALTVAKDVLKETRPDAKPLIVLLSDGKMDPDPAKGSSATFTDKLMNEVLPDMKIQGIKVYTLALSEEADKDLLAQIAASTEGVRWFTPNADKIHESFADLFLAVKKPQVVPLSPKGFTIDGDVQEATFYVNREGTAEVRLKTPNGTDLTADSHPDQVRWFKGQHFEVITITKPDIGNWQVFGISPNEGFATILTNLKLVTDWEGVVNSGEGALLQARLYEEKKPVALPEMTGAIRFAFQITPTDKIAEPIVREYMVDDGTHGDKIAADGIFSYFVKLSDPGEYKLRVLAKAPTFERQQQLPFRVREPMVVVSFVNEKEGDDDQKDGEHHEGKHEGGEHEDGDHKEEHKEGEHKDEHSDHGEEKHEEAKPQHGAGEGIAVGNESTTILVTLSEETLDIRNLQLKLIAVNRNRERFTIPVTKVAGSQLKYEVSAAVLPGDGVYQFQATISGDGPGKKAIKESSRTVSFERHSVSEATEVVVHVEEKPKQPENSFPLVELIIVTIVSVGTGLFAFSLVRKTQGGTVEEGPDVSLPLNIVQAIEALEKRLSLTEIDLNDPLLTEADAEDLSQSAAVSAPPPPAPGPAPAEVTEEVKPAEEAVPEAPPPSEEIPAE